MFRVGWVTRVLQGGRNGLGVKSRRKHDCFGVLRVFSRTRRVRVTTPYASRQSSTGGRCNRLTTTAITAGVTIASAAGIRIDLSMGRVAPHESDRLTRPGTADSTRRYLFMSERHYRAVAEGFFRTATRTRQLSHSNAVRGIGRGYLVGFCDSDRRVRDVAPAPMGTRISYGPNRVPAERGMVVGMILSNWEMYG